MFVAIHSPADSMYLVGWGQVVTWGPATEAARRYAMLMGISNPLVAHAESIDTRFSFFVMYGACSHTLDPEQILVDELAHAELDFYAVNELIEKELGRRVTVIGAAIESDAHTVGIDAIFNATATRRDAKSAAQDAGGDDVD